MRSAHSLFVATAAMCLMLAGCGQKEPKGQVVATFDGKEITAIDLRNEMGSFTAPTPAIRKQAEQQALNQILVRKALAQAAEKAGVGKTPEFAQREKALHEALLVQTWQSQIAKMVPAPSKVEIDKYIADHPDTYGQRKIWLVDQVMFPRTADQALLAGLQPLKTLPEVTAYLNSHQVPNRVGQAEIDTVRIDPRLVDQIIKLPPTEVFVVPNGEAIVANQIRETRVVPLTGDAAVKHATAILKAQRTQEAVQRQFGAVVAGSKDKVKYSKAYEPPAPPSAAKAAPAAAAPKK